METVSRHLEDLNAFHWVAKDQSFTKAATRTGVSKAQLSKQVQRLEAVLGMKLLVRTTRQVRLTEEGVQLSAYAARILDLSEEAGRKMTALRHGTAGKLRITAPVSLGETFFPEFTKALQTLLPGVQLEADVSNEEQDFSEGKVDFAIRAMEVEHPDLVARYLGKIKDVIVCAPALARSLRLTDPAELARENCILSSLETDWNIWTLISSKKETQVRVQGSVATNQYTLARLYALGGLGITRLPQYYVENDLREKKLHRLFPDYQIATHALYLVYDKRAMTTKRHQVARDWLLKWFKSRKDFFVS
jgi:DNA-binding transcriptional LysR family regulator